MAINKSILALLKTAFLMLVLSVIGVVAAADVKEAPEVSIHIEVNNKSYVIGEPIDLIVSLKNDGTSPNRLGAAFDIREGSLGFYISDDGVKYKGYSGPFWGTRDSFGGESMLRPKSTMTQKIRILHNTRGIPKIEITGYLAFPTDGKFYMKAAMSYRDIAGGMLESNVVELDIASPEGDDAKVFELLNNSESIFFLHTGTYEDRLDEIKRYPAILNQYPDSIYAKYLEYSLSRHESNMAFRKKIREEREALEAARTKQSETVSIQKNIVSSEVNIEPKIQAEVIESKQIEVEEVIETPRVGLFFWLLVISGMGLIIAVLFLFGSRKN